MELLNFFTEALGVIPHIKTVISLIAFLALIGGYIIIKRLSNDRKKLESIPEIERSDTSLALAGKYRIPIDNLTKTQQYDVVMSTLSNKYKKSRNLYGLIAFIVIVIVVAIVITPPIGDTPIKPIKNITVNITDIGPQLPDIEAQFEGANEWVRLTVGAPNKTNDIPGDPSNHIHIRIKQKGYEDFETITELKKVYSFKLTRLTYWIKGPDECNLEINNFIDFFNVYIEGSHFLDRNSTNVIQISFSGSITKDSDIAGNCKYKGGVVIIKKNQVEYRLVDLEIGNVDWHNPGGNPCEIITSTVCNKLLDTINSNNEKISQYILDKQLLQ